MENSMQQQEYVLFVINEQIIEEPTLISSIEVAAQAANGLGLKGIDAYSFKFVKYDKGYYLKYKIVEDQEKYD